MVAASLVQVLIRMLSSTGHMCCTSATGVLVVVVVMEPFI